MLIHTNPCRTEFMSDFELEDTLSSEQTDMKKRNVIYTADENFDTS